MKNSNQKPIDSSKKEKSGESQRIIYKCNICHDTTWILNKEGYARRCQCYKAERAKLQLNASGLNIEDADKNFKNYREHDEISSKLKFAAVNYFLKFDGIRKEKNNSILLCGSSGCGKTHLSIALANNFLNKGKKVVYMPYRDAATKIKQNMLDKQCYEKIIDKYKRAEILLIDDLWKGKITPSDINIVFEIVNYRYINRMPIIVSSEYILSEILSVDEAIGSRIYEMCKGFIVEVKGDNHNYRLKNQ